MIPITKSGILKRVEGLTEALQTEFVRDIEIRLAKEEKWLDVGKKQPDPAVEDPGESLLGYEEMGVMADLMVAAMNGSDYAGSAVRGR